MNFKTRLLTALLLAGGILYFNACKDDDCCSDPCENCGSGYACIDNACQCPDGNLELGGNCITLSAGTFVGYGPSCLCYDTLALAFLGQGVDRIVQMPFVLNGAPGSASTNASYYEKPDGDSIYILELPITCTYQDSIKVFPEAFGKVQPDGTMLLNLVFRHSVTRKVLDSCTMTMKQQ
ncbi:MAG: hypothetical protein H6575_07115 [Lewinellaceae bacterium]|nr:hypothetical protein [Saprospiraceae bacterium]MCB9354320.1 hypothetical protein [Lewinellaceae bacterium]